MSRMQSYIDEFHPRPEYHAGRLLAVCQHIQDLTASDVSRTYVDSYFAAACANPKSILPVVWKAARSRLRQISYRKVRVEVEDLATRIVNLMGYSWPQVNRRDVAAVFQLGFFHQRAVLPVSDTRVRYLTLDGTSVKSYGEKLISDILYSNAIEAIYERELQVPDPSKATGVSTLSPDFTVNSADGTRSLYIEYCGLVGIPEYEKQWGYKRACYARLGAQTLQDVQTAGSPSQHTLMTIVPMDVRNSLSLKSSILDAVSLITGANEQTEGSEVF